MLLDKRNVIVYTIQIDAEKVKAAKLMRDVIDLFKETFAEAGLIREAKRMDDGGFSYKMTEENDFFKEYEICITKRGGYI